MATISVCRAQQPSHSTTTIQLHRLRPLHRRPPPPPSPPPPPAVITIAPGGDATEGGASGSFIFTRTGDTSTAITVGFGESGSADPNIDYAAPNLILFGGGDTSETYTFAAMDDSLVEGTETITFTIASGDGYDIGTPDSATINLHDNDKFQVSVAELGSDPIEGNTGTFRISRTGGTSGDLPVAYSIGGTATSGSDYTAASGSATIPDGLDYVDVSVPTLKDNLVEGDETVIMTISASAAYTFGDPSTATVNILDDPPVIGMSPTNTTEGSDVPGNVQFSRTGGDTTSALSISYTIGGTATNGVDYSTISGSVTIAAGCLIADVPITALVDNNVENGGETVTLTIVPTNTYVLAGNAATAVTDVTISDDPPIVTVVAVNEAAEPSTNGTFEFIRSGGDTSKALTVSYGVSGTATPDVDYTALSGSVTFPAGTTVVDVTVSVIDDTLVEDDESVEVQLNASANNLVGDPGADVVMIADNDKIVFTADTTYIPINANRDDKSPWMVIGNVTYTGIPYLRDMDVAPSRDLSGWNGRGDPPQGTAINDPDLKKMTVTIVNGNATGQITVQVIYADGVTGGRINLWADQAKTTAVLLNQGGISGGGSATLPGYPTSNFYVEGIRPSLAKGDITLKVSYTQNGVTTTHQEILTVTPVVNAFRAAASAPGTNTFETNAGKVNGITSGDEPKRHGIGFTANLTTNSMIGDPYFLQNVTALEQGNPVVELTDGTQYNTSLTSDLFPVLDSAFGFNPFYPTAPYSINNKTQRNIFTFDTPALGDNLFSGRLSFMDAAFKARMYLTWKFPDDTIYTLAYADWQTKFIATTLPFFGLTLSSDSVTSASPMVVSNSNPGTIVGSYYNAIVTVPGFWVKQ